MSCIHNAVTCLNPYELIRKYRCDSCGGVMMCGCEEDFARRFLPHQLDMARELQTQRRIPVDLGFQERVCNICRGLPEEAHPKTGRGNKAVRYYWREIFFETTKKFADWAANEGYGDLLDARFKYPEVYKKIEKAVIEEIKELHRFDPKYTYREESQDDVTSKYRVELVKFDGVYVKSSGKGVAIQDGTDICSAEEYVSRHYERQGYSVLTTESVPFHVLFGVFNWSLIQDPTDPLIRLSGFGDRFAFEEGRKGEIIQTFLPQDFGSPGYAKRNGYAIEKHFKLLELQDDLGWIFDFNLEDSSDFRQYLWAHREEKVETARKLISVLPQPTIINILKYLTGSYWERYLGWPDLLVYDEKEFFFVEVKSSGDKLSEEQKAWIRGNATEMQLPFKIAKIHKKKTLTAYA